MLKKIRIALAAVFFTVITLLFLDFTGTIHAWFGWTAKIQFLPALLALNFGVVAALILLTLLFGRIYCSVICPLGVMQDIISWFGGKRKKWRFGWKSSKKWLRYGVLALFIILMVAGINSVAILVAPYSAYGRIASNLLAPIYQACNNLFAWFAERADSYAFYSTDVWIKSLTTFIIAIVTFVVIFILAFRGGRTWCNTICPVGTVLGFFSRFAIFRPLFDLEKCNGCTLCARGCKASCINPKEHKIDMSRCVACMDCIGNCRQGAISYRPVLPWKKSAAAKQHSAPQAKSCGPQNETLADNSRRAFLAGTAIALTAATLSAGEKKVREGAATLAGKRTHKRETPLKPAGSVSLKHFSQHCTGCQLCVSVCPNRVLRPSQKFDTLMQPEMSYELGYCRPECTKCSQVCPAGAIRAITPVEKSSIQIGHAVVVPDNCVVMTDNVSCGNCARHCPVGAIKMVPREAGDKLRIPAVNPERCIGCGACENLCPAQPLSAIYVEGHLVHKEN